jgi:hypothetical protein
MMLIFGVVVLPGFAALLGMARVWTNAVRHTFHVVGAVAVLAMVVIKWIASKDGKPHVCHCAMFMIVPIIVTLGV